MTIDSLAIPFFLYLVIVISAVFHEYAHGLVAHRLGDPTAKHAGRLTLNPLVHMDLFGTVILPLFLLFGPILMGGSSGIFIGWAKPVPYNPNLLRDKKYGSLKVGIAGIATNFFIALSLGLFLRFFSGSAVILNMFGPMFLSFLSIVVYINIFLAVFNFIPMPPLDGSKVFADLFPRFWSKFMNLGIGGIFIAIFLAFLILPTITNFIFRLIVGFGFHF